MKITDMTVSSLAAAVEKRELTAREITESYLNRIGETEGRINAYITVCAEKALEAAEEADADVKSILDLLKSELDAVLR